MKIEFKGKTISNIKDWEKEIFSTSKKDHWKIGRSAHSLANFILNNKGEKRINNEISKIIGEEITFDVAYPEYEVRFDKYGQGREHDLGIYGTTASGKKIFVGIEAKVDEPFGDTILQAYIKGKIKELNEENTNAPKRIEELLKITFKKIKKEYFDLRYQLLFSTIGTLSVDVDIHFFFVIVFKTDLLDLSKAKQNKEDYNKFFRLIGTKLNDDNYKVISNGKTLKTIYIMV